MELEEEQRNRTECVQKSVRNEYLCNIMCSENNTEFEMKAESVSKKKSGMLQKDMA